MRRKCGRMDWQRGQILSSESRMRSWGVWLGKGMKTRKPERSISVGAIPGPWAADFLVVNIIWNKECYLREEFNQYKLPGNGAGLSQQSRAGIWDLKLATVNQRSASQSLQIAVYQVSCLNTKSPNSHKELQAERGESDNGDWVNGAEPSAVSGQCLLTDTSREPNTESVRLSVSLFCLNWDSFKICWGLCGEKIWNIFVGLFTVVNIIMIPLFMDRMSQLS